MSCVFFFSAILLVSNSITNETTPLNPPQIVLETEYDNFAALSLYESLGFMREKRLHRFYLNGKDAFRLVLVMPPAKDDCGENTPPQRSNMGKRFRRPPHRAIRVSPYSDDEDEISSR